MNIDIRVANYLDKNHASDINYLLNSYSEDPMGAGEPLSEYCKNNLVIELSKIPQAFSVIAYANGKPAGLANCFQAFSTFKCKPLINVHDFIVVEGYRGHGISQRILSKIEEIAKERSCCKITLEVLEGNTIAQNSYRKFGFEGYQLDPKIGNALFWQKSL